ncbi:MAG: hypothetical protein ACRC46_03425 [Thermoguttaceae bacterium]
MKTSRCTFAAAAASKDPLRKRRSTKRRKEYISAEYALRAMEYAKCAEWRLVVALWRFGGLRRCWESENPS